MRAPVGLSRAWISRILETLSVKSASGRVALRPTMRPTNRARSRHIGAESRRDRTNTPSALRPNSSGRPMTSVRPSGRASVLQIQPAGGKDVFVSDGTGPIGRPTGLMATSCLPRQTSILYPTSALSRIASGTACSTEVLSSTAPPSIACASAGAMRASARCSALAQTNQETEAAVAASVSELRSATRTVPRTTRETIDRPLKARPPTRPGTVRSRVRGSSG